MKWKNSFVLLLVIFCLSGCVVFSFYPLYTQKDLFANDYLLGNYLSSDTIGWNFTFLTKNVDDKVVADSTGYCLKVDESKDSSFISTFDVHLIRIGGILIADFYLKDYSKSKKDDVRLFDLHIIPVHTFAKVIFEGDRIHFRWFDGDWLKKLIEANRVRIRHENNGENILLTAKPDELQKFLKKYLNSEEAFKDGLEIKLTKQKR
jgi:hypothetical protein